MIQWNEQNRNRMKALYAKSTTKEIAAELGTTERAIYKEANKLGLHKKQPNAIVLTEQQKSWLVRNFPHVSNDVCASILGMSLRTVVRKARRLGLEKTAQFRHECSLYGSKRAVETLRRSGKLPQKGYYSPNLQKGEPYQFKRKTAAGE